MEPTLKLVCVYLCVFVYIAMYIVYVYMYAEGVNLLHEYVYNVYVCDISSLGINQYNIVYTGLNGVLLLENESH